MNGLPLGVAQGKLVPLPIMEPGTHKAPATAVAQDLVAVSLPKLCGYFLWLGATGFGGPIALAGYMQHDLVERRRWVTREDYLEGLALAQLAPGPLAAQLAIYLGYSVPEHLEHLSSAWRSSVRRS